MTDFQEGHPCNGRDCKDCETCIFDRDLFADGVKPNEKKEINKNNTNMFFCNNCVNLEKSTDHCPKGKFDACCKLVKYEAFGNSRPRRIDYNVTDGANIITPCWCPLKAESANIMSASNSQTSSYTPISNKRDMMKQLRKRTEWKDIQEGKVYVIPKILTQAKKIVKVITKTDLCCTCHEISEYTGNEYAYNTMIYPSDIDAVFITELRNF